MTHRGFDLLANISQTLRTPLEQIVDVSALLQDEIGGELNERQKTQVSGVSAASTELLAVVGDLIDLARLETGAATVAFTRCDISPMIHEAVAQLRPVAYQKRIMLATYSDDCLVCTNVDPEWIRRLFVTVVSNAVAIAEPQSMVTIHFEACDDAGDTRTSQTSTDFQVTIRVHHSSLAAPETEDESRDIEQLAALYERHSGGFGVRLALAHMIVRRHGGSARVLHDDTASHALTFALTLPTDSRVAAVTSNCEQTA